VLQEDLVACKTYLEVCLYGAMNIAIWKLCDFFMVNKNRDSSVGIATGYGMDLFPAGTRHIFFLHIVHTGSEAHPVSYLMGTGGNAAGA
jgi:hypothetical protein